MFIYLFWERECVQGRGTEWGRESQAGSTLSTEPDAGLDLRNCEIITWAQINNLMLNRLSHPGAPNLSSTFIKSQEFSILIPVLFFFLISNRLRIKCQPPFWDNHLLPRDGSHITSLVPVYFWLLLQLWVFILTNYKAQTDNIYRQWWIWLISVEFKVLYLCL